MNTNEFKNTFNEVYTETVKEEKQINNYKLMLERKGICPKFDIRFHLMDRYEFSPNPRIAQFLFSSILSLISGITTYYFTKNLLVAFIAVIAASILSGIVTYFIDYIVWCVIPRSKYIKIKTKEEEEKQAIIKEISGTSIEESENESKDFSELYDKINITLKNLFAYTKAVDNEDVARALYRLAQLVENKETQIQKNSFSPRTLYKYISIYLKEIILLTSKADLTDKKTKNEILSLINKLYKLIDEKVEITDTIQVDTGIDVINKLLDQELGKGGNINEQA